MRVRMVAKKGKRWWWWWGGGGGVVRERDVQNDIQVRPSYNPIQCVKRKQEMEGR